MLLPYTNQPLFPYTTLFRSPLNAFGDYDPVNGQIVMISVGMSNTTQEFSRFVPMASADPTKNPHWPLAQSGKIPASDRKSTRLNSSHQIISYAVFCLKKKKK